MGWEPGLGWMSSEDTQIVVVVLAGLDFEDLIKVAFAPDLKMSAAAGEHDFGVRRNAGLLAEILGDQELALVIESHFTAEHRELAEHLAFFGGGLVAVVDDLNSFGVSGFTEGLHQRHVVFLGEQQEQGTALLGTPSRLDGDSELRVHLRRLEAFVTLFKFTHGHGGGKQW